MITNILLTDMKHYFLLFILLLVIITIEGCTEELHPETNGTNSPVLNEEVTVNGVNSNEDSYRLTDRFLFTLYIS